MNDDELALGCEINVIMHTGLPSPHSSPGTAQWAENAALDPFVQADSTEFTLQ